MKLITFFLTSAFCLSIHARDTKNLYPIDDVLNMPTTKSKLGTDVKFLFGSATKPKNIKHNYGEFSANKKTNAFNKSDKQACDWAFLSALVSLRDRAKQLGGNAVVNIQSNYKKNRTDKTEVYECGAGALMAGVTLVGEVVKLE